MTDPEGLYAAHQQGLFKYFCRAVGPDTAHDLTQDVFLRVSRTTIPIAADGEVRAWLFHIARNLALDHHRQRLRRPEPAVLTDEGARSASQDVDFAVNEALAALPDLDRDVFTWKDPKRIAASLKRSAEHSHRRRGTPFRSAMSMLTFYINRAGHGLDAKQKKVL